MGAQKLVDHMRRWEYDEISHHAFNGILGLNNHTAWLSHPAKCCSTMPRETRSSTTNQPTHSQAVHCKVKGCLNIVMEGLCIAILPSIYIRAKGLLFYMSNENDQC